MSTTPRLPPAPEPQLLGAEVSGHVAEFYGHTDAALHAYGLAVWKAAMELAAEMAWQMKQAHIDGGFSALDDLEHAVRSLALPEGNNQ